MIGKVNWRVVEHYYAQNYCERATDKMCGRCKGCAEIRNSWMDMRRTVKLHTADEEHVRH